MSPATRQDNSNTSSQHPRLMYIHQTKEQQCLLNAYKQQKCALEVKYRNKKSSLPMFLVCLKRNIWHLLFHGKAIHPFSYVINSGIMEGE